MIFEEHAVDTLERWIDKVNRGAAGEPTDGEGEGEGGEGSYWRDGTHGSAGARPRT